MNELVSLPLSQVQARHLRFLLADVYGHYSEYNEDIEISLDQVDEMLFEAGVRVGEPPAPVEYDPPHRRRLHLSLSRPQAEALIDFYDAAVTPEYGQEDLEYGLQEIRTAYLEQMEEL